MGAGGATCGRVLGLRSEGGVCRLGGGRGPVRGLAVVRSLVGHGVIFGERGQQRSSGRALYCENFCSEKVWWTVRGFC